jgi:hypothetical protein
VNAAAGFQWTKDTQHNTFVNNDALKQIAEALNKVPKKRQDASTDDARPGTGCDGEIDIQDDRALKGERSPDECDEDRYLPSLVVPLFGFELKEPGMYAITEKKFPSENDALEFLEKQIQPTDDCAYKNQLKIVMTYVPGTTCGDTAFHVTPSEFRCPDSGYDVGNAETFIAHVDGTKPVVTCGFRPTNIDEKLLNEDHGKEQVYIDSTSKEDLVDVGFFFEIEVSPRKLPFISFILLHSRSNDAA